MNKPLLSGTGYESVEVVPRPPVAPRTVPLFSVDPAVVRHDEQIASSPPLHVRFRLEQFPDPKSKEVAAPLAVVFARLSVIVTSLLGSAP